MNNNNTRLVPAVAYKTLIEMTSIRILKCSVLATYSEDNSKSSFATSNQDIRNNGVDFNVRNDTFTTHVIHFPVSKKPSFIAIRVEEVDNACIHAYIDIHIQIQTPAEESWHGGTGGPMALLLKFFRICQTCRICQNISNILV